ncbi:MAG: hypothetical protein J7K17_01165 [Candidatus Omnitrophica bacterium]|nr:hypothetical protein [Candidatus Omnitrophota bacterium]
MVKYLLDREGKFIIENYNKAYPFSNFLPAISGIWGIPLWAFYVNRGQCMVSFGVKDKNHSILEFLPADRAYQASPILGFRTFIKLDDRFYYEPFKLNFGYSKQERMIITSYDLTLEEENRYLGLKFSVNYFTLPNMPFASLVRILKIKNNSKKKLKLKILDGLARIIPFGSREIFLKYLSHTLQAWMNSEIKKISNKEIALFRLIVDPKDVSAIHYIEGTNFYYPFCDNKETQPKVIVDPQKIFGEDTTFNVPVVFLDKKINLFKNQVLCGKTPCGFGFLKKVLNYNEELIIYTLIGALFKMSDFKEKLKDINTDFVDRKKEENKEIIESIKNNAWCISSSYRFNEYIKSSYLDNILRGGYPFKFDNSRVYYLFSRKHGDLERDYNKFRLLPSYFSEGESNYRDINQNRRMDLFFNPYLYHKNVIYFMNLIRMDGYNPLLVRGEKLFFESEKVAKNILKKHSLPQEKDILFLLKDGFYLGEFFNLLEERRIKVKNREKLANLILEKAKSEPEAKFKDGFWIDHWHYNLDLIEGFLYFYPDKKEELFLNTDFMFWDDEFRVKERRYRYILKDKRILQLNSLEEVPEKKELILSRKRFKNFLRTNYGKGKVYKANLVEKLLTLILNKITSLDFEGMGVEMEADKPGWCDSLNGLPALFGSSLCETFELKRAVLLLKSIVKNDSKKVRISKEIFNFLIDVEKLLDDYLNKRANDLLWWERANSLKEEFRKKVFWGIEGKQVIINLSYLEKFLDKVVKKLDIGISKAKDKKTGVYFSYFTYQIKEYELEEYQYIKPKKVTLKPLPLFLEAPVHALRVNKEVELYRKVKKTGLYDKKLKMYRLNVSLKECPLEIGRSRIFPRGWLENESIWLHMEYKYLLELLKNGLYEEFYKEIFKCGICFLNPTAYGRSILENSSFIVSSVYPDKSLWGKGFVARLTGATSEVLNIWILMCLGKNPFFVDKNNNFCIKFSPILKGDLFTKRGTTINLDNKVRKLEPNAFAFKLFSSILVIYYNPKRKNTYSENIKMEKIIIDDGNQKTVLKDSLIKPPLSYKIREAKVREIEVHFS